MSQPMKIEFSIAVANIERARSLGERIAAFGYVPNIYVDDATDSLSNYCAKTMLATL